MDTLNPLQSLQVFKTEVIHGIIELNTSTIAKDPIKCLIWGGKSVCIVLLENSVDQKGVLEVKLRIYSSELSLNDWILDACCHTSSSDKCFMKSLSEIFLISSHNILLSLFLNSPSQKDSSHSISSTTFALGPQSILYSAHLTYLDPGRLLVASGTVFGEVLIWTCPNSSILDSDGVQTGTLAYSFSGHEGSVYGVRIADGFTCPGYDVAQRFVVSCSDDRTIRIWDISNLDSQVIKTEESDHQTGFGEARSDDTRQGSQCLAIAMGHASRIWGVRFLSRKDSRWQILSYGEDASSHIWHFDYPTAMSKRPSTLRLEGVYEYHAGKNIWAVVASKRPDGTYIVSTGGADGRIVLYTVEFDNTQDLNSARVTSGDEDDVPLSTMPSSFLGGRTPATSIFGALQGHWDLRRVLRSKIPSYPSGFFKGTASLVSRFPTDQLYDGEYLYSEEGVLTTEQGLSLKGSRQYVYRYQRKNDTITAWFVKPEDHSSVDYFFHLFEFEKYEESNEYHQEQPSMIAAAGHHLCVDDQYDTAYTFNLNDSGLKSWSVKYDVKGPQKDYCADATYTRNPVTTSDTDRISVGGEASKQRSKQPVEPERVQEQKGRSLFKQRNVPRSYSWVAEREILATTVEGKVIIGELRRQDSTKIAVWERFVQPDVSWTEVAHIEDLASHSLVTSLFGLEAALLSGRKGFIYLYIRAQRCISLMKTLPDKVSNIFSQELSIPSWLPINDQGKSFGIIVTCVGSQTAYLFAVESGRRKGEDFTISKLTNIELPSSFIVTSTHWIESESLLALGSRDGNLCLYDTSSLRSTGGTVVASRSLLHLHGKDAITVILTMPSYPLISGTYILTAGRDGKYAVHRIRACRGSANLKIHFVTLHKSKPPFGPNIEGAYFDDTTNDLLLWGFRSTSFVVWNCTRQQEIFFVSCGGAHRSWTYQPTAGGKGGRFVWTKASTYNIHIQNQPSHLVLQSGSHGREIKTMAFYTSNDGTPIGNLMVTGSEDTTIRIQSLNPTSTPQLQGTNNELILQGHTTGVRQVRFSPNGTLLFSAGSNEEFFVWRIAVVPGFPMGHTLDGVCPLVTPAADLRIMDFAVVGINGDVDKGLNDQLLITIVYSDSSIRVSVLPLETCLYKPSTFPSISR